LETLDLTFRLAARDDLAAVDALMARSYARLLAADYPPSVLVTALPLIARARPELLASGTYWLAEDGEGRIVGAGGWTRAARGWGRPPGATAQVRHLITDAGQVRRGIARRLMGKVLSQAEAAGISGMECLSTRTAVPFYRAIGFRELGEVAISLRPGIEFPAVQMIRIGQGPFGAV
jgi:predicted N-acetyltransferase YhbS